MRIGTVLRAAVALPIAAALVLCLIAFHELFWRWRDCFNEAGRCFDPAAGIVYHEQSGIVWSGLAAVCALALGAVLALRR